MPDTTHIGILLTQVIEQLEILEQDYDVSLSDIVLELQSRRATIEQEVPQYEQAGTH